MRAHSQPSPNSNRPATKIILVTPPPVDEYQLEADGAPRRRTAEGTKGYADACLDVAVELDAVVVDLWGIMMKKAGWDGKEGEVLVGSKKRERSGVLGELLKDGEFLESTALREKRDRYQWSSRGSTFGISVEPVQSKRLPCWSLKADTYEL